MAATNLVHNEAHMKEISKLYLECAEKIVDAHHNIDLAACSFSSCYEGYGDNLFSATIDAAYEHLRLLETCARVLGAFVDRSLAEALGKDLELARQLRKETPLK